MKLVCYMRESNEVCYKCTICNKKYIIDLKNHPIFRSLDDNICILSDGESLVCEGCGDIHSSDTPLIKNQTQEQNSIPRCPTCNSNKIHKISVLNKVGSVATFGLLSTGHVSKTFKCDSCGMKF